MSSEIAICVQNRRRFAEFTGRDVNSAQDNHSRTAKNVQRGLHYPIQQPKGKPVRVVKGAVFDVAVGIGRGSPTFGQYVAVERSAENKRMSDTRMSDNRRLRACAHFGYRSVSLQNHRLLDARIRAQHGLKRPGHRHPIAHRRQA